MRWCILFPKELGLRLCNARGLGDYKEDKEEASEGENFGELYTQRMHRLKHKDWVEDLFHVIEFNHVCY